MPSKPRSLRPTHLGTAEPRQQQDQERGSARQRGYDRQWDVEAAAYKVEHPLCLGCEAVGWVTPARVVDHIIPHRGNRVLFWDPTNRQPACDTHHNVVKQHLEQLFAKGKATAADLRLDSPKARAATMELMG